MNYYMGKLKTSAVFYRRGISNNNVGFGLLAQSNFQIVQPTYLFSLNGRVNNTNSQNANT